MRKLSKVMMIVGMFLIVATAGASDLGNIGIPQMIVQSIIGLILMYGGFYIWHIDAN